MAWELDPRVKINALFLRVCMGLKIRLDCLQLYAQAQCGTENSSFRRLSRTCDTELLTFFATYVSGKAPVVSFELRAYVYALPALEIPDSDFISETVADLDGESFEISSAVCDDVNHFYSCTCDKCRGVTTNGK